MMIEKYFGIDKETAKRLIEATENMTNEKSGDNSFQSTKVYLFDEYAVLKTQNMNYRNVSIEDMDLRHLENLAETLLRLKAKGIHVVPILAFQSDDGNGYIIQARARGAELYDKDKMNDKAYVLERVKLLSDAPQEHFDKFVEDTIKIIDAGAFIDFMGKDNFFYDEAIGFQFIDLNAHFDYVYGLSNAKPPAMQIAAWHCFLQCYYDTVPPYRDTVTNILSELTDNERALLSKHNRIIFNKCKTAMINNGIAEDVIDGIISNEMFIPQKRQVGLP